MSQTTRTIQRIRCIAGRAYGFTVMEIMIGIGIAGLVLAAASSLMLASFSDATRGDAKLAADSAATYAANRILIEVREAKRSWFTPYTWEWGVYDTLWVVYPTQTGDGIYDRTVDGQVVAYFLMEDRLYRYTEAEGYRQIAEHIESIGFVGSADMVQITVTANVEGQRATRTEQVHMRNS